RAPVSTNFTAQKKSSSNAGSAVDLIWALRLALRTVAHHPRTAETRLELPPPSSFRVGDCDHYASGRSLFGWFVWPTPYEPIIVNGVVIGFRHTEPLRHRGARVSPVREPNAPGGDDRGSADRGADLHSPRAAQRAGAGGPSPTA